MTQLQQIHSKLGTKNIALKLWLRRTKRPLQVVNERFGRLEDRFHHTVKMIRLGDGRSWTGASDIESWYMNDLPAYLQRWLFDCFAQWDPNAIPEGFEIPQG